MMKKKHNFHELTIRVFTCSTKSGTANENGKTRTW
jgi:hypothetical protein